VARNCRIDVKVDLPISSFSKVVKHSADLERSSVEKATCSRSHW
jgi:hypothetical protein